MRPPSRDTADWDALRAWFDRKGWTFIAMLGDADFQDAAQVPEGKIPLSGTMYELFDAMRTGDETNLKIYNLKDIAPALEADEPIAGQQAEWCQRLLDELSKNFSVRAPGSKREFMESAEEDLRQAFDVPRLDPLKDPLPGLDAVSSTIPLLFGRGQDIVELSRCVFQDNQAAFTRVVGVSGAGKSSLMRSGLMREWFKVSPRGLGRREKATALLVEPQLLQFDDMADPLETLAKLLRTDLHDTPDRVVGPRPGPLTVDPPPLAPPSGDLKIDLPKAISWWAALTEELQGPFVLILDQAEQIEADARRTAQAEADRTGQHVEPVLSPQWRRFTGLFAALCGVLDPACLTPALAARIEEINNRAPLRLLLTLHRESALDLWPLAARETLPEPVQVAPLATQAEWQSVIEDTCRTYGLDLDEQLGNQMVNEAAKLAKSPVSVSGPDGDQIPTTHAEASVLPQVRTALQRIITRWGELHKRKSDREKRDKAAYTLDFETFAPFAGIAGAIDALGEAAWESWQKTLAESTRTNLRSIFGQRELAEEQNRRFANLMSGLVDARNVKQQDLSKLLRGGERARRHQALVEALLERRILTRVGEGLDRLYFLLSHRSVLDHWQRAAEWLKQTAPRLKVKAKLIPHYQLEDTSDRWREDDLDDFAGLALNWIGSGEEDDGRALDYLKSRLCARLDPAQVGLWAKTGLARLPFAALFAGDTSFFGDLLDKCVASPVWADIAPGLVIAISSEGEVAFLEAALDGADTAALCNTVDEETGAFPLLLAAQNGHAEVVGLLLDKDAEPNRVNEDGLFPLLMAAQQGHAEVVRLLLDKDADPNQVNEKDGLFPLLMAAQNGHAEVVRLLLDKDADPNQVNEKDGLFPLLQAAQNGHAEVVGLLLDKDAEPNQVNEKDGLFPLLQAAKNGHAEVVGLLLGKDAEPNRVNEKEGTFPLLLAAQNGLAEVVRLLLDKDAEPNQVDEKTGNFPLLLAAQQGHAEVVRLLLDKDAEPNRVHEDGLFPLLLAAQEGHAEAVRLLLDKDAEPNQVDEKTGNFPLLLAAQQGHAEVVGLLLDKDAEPNQVNEKHGLFPLLLAAQQGHAEVVGLLLDKDAEPNRVNEKEGTFPLLLAAQQGHAEVVGLLLGKDAEPNRVNEKEGTFPLLQAAKNGHAEVVRLLLDNGADITQQHEPSGITPLAAAIMAKQGSTAILLLDSGALIRDLSKPLVALMVHILSGGDWPRNGESEDARQQTWPDHDASVDLAAIPAFPIPGHWASVDVDKRLEKGLSEILEQLHSSPDIVVKSHLLSRRLSLSGNDSVCLWQSALTVAQTEHTLIVDLLWLDGDDRFEPLLLFPGVPLDDILVGLKDNSVLPDFRFPETQMVWAALALLLGGDVYLTPLMQSSELPLADGAAKPMFIRPEEQWREWSAATGPEGPYVELPWIEGRDLVWGKVLAPDGGVGLRVLADREVLARDIGWAIPQFAAGEDKKPLPFRILGMIEEKQQ